MLVYDRGCCSLAAPSPEPLESPETPSPESPVTRESPSPERDAHDSHSLQTARTVPSA